MPTKTPTPRRKQPKKWIKEAIEKPGALKEQLGVAKDKPIPPKMLEAAKKKPGLKGKRARLADTLKKMQDKGKKKGK